MSATQFGLIDAITKYLSRHGHTHANVRQLNAIIEAATAIIDELGRPHVDARPGMGLEDWRASDDTGASSKAMAWRLSRETGQRFGRPADPQAHPHDPADFGRCVRLLDAVPEMRPYIGAMADVSPVWGRLIGEWDSLEALYREEWPKGVAPKLYARMRQIIEARETEAHNTEGHLP